MAEIDKVKEQIGLLKVVFALLIAIDVALMALIAQNFTTKDRLLLSLTMVALGFVTFAIVIIKSRVQNEIDRLGGL